MMGAPPPGQGGFSVIVKITSPPGWTAQQTEAFWDRVKAVLNVHGKPVGDNSQPQRPLSWQRFPEMGPQKGYIASIDPNSTNRARFAEDYKTLRATLTGALKQDFGVVVDEWSDVTYVQGGRRGSLAKLWNVMRSQSKKKPRGKGSKGKGPRRKSRARKKSAR